jgi:adenylate cyclase
MGRSHAAWHRHPHLSPVVAGVVGRSKFNFDVWGETVDVAPRLSDYGSDGAVYLSEVT